ncbi:homoserine acetyltransferase [Rhizoclosmatium globosum]|uniref:Homoserine acetyltransferase n=1 Tax=Rhizoclosmatium globosum TaxID=329046 RepID=A0A1Y2CH17_9FUNG|nr:homoserine acetyltransferase [Rhizoclosmatium globosum]|eukprot:ORY46338.1 homoserine acetyltransferase [Rhizoclosmatium globosum]
MKHLFRPTTSRLLSGTSNAAASITSTPTFVKPPFAGHSKPTEATPKVAHKLYSHESTFKLHLGGSLPRFDVAFESWGRLNERRDNVILLTTGLSASSHAKSHFGNRADGWWEKFIGPGLPLDTDKFHVICTNVIGGCYGSTGPSSIDPVASEKSGLPVRYGTNFPMVTIWDMMRAQFKLLDGSMGGMLSLAAAAMYPDRVGRVISISAAARSHPYSIALRHMQRSVLMSDPNWLGGHYYDSGVIPAQGLSVRTVMCSSGALIGTTNGYNHISIGPEWEQRFGRKRKDPKAERTLKTDFMIESYLEHQGNKWVGQYDANSLIYLSRAMDMFDMTESKEIATCLRDAGNKRVTHFEIDGVYGHDTFLLDFTNVGSAVKGHVEIELTHAAPGEWHI